MTGHYADHVRGHQPECHPWFVDLSKQVYRCPRSKIHVDTHGNFRLTMEVPGIPRDNILVKVDRHRVLLVSGKRRTVKTWGAGADGGGGDDGCGEWRVVVKDGGDAGWKGKVESHYEIHRAFKIPSNADTARLEAKYRDGVLRVSIPVKEEE